MRVSSKNSTRAATSTVSMDGRNNRIVIRDCNCLENTSHEHASRTRFPLREAFCGLLVFEPDAELGQTMLPHIAPLDALPNFDLVFRKLRFFLFELDHQLLNQLVARLQ
jgi:hypothetical protein